MNTNRRFTKKKKISSSGMTLIEVIVAIAIMGIVAIGLLPMFSTGIKLLVNNGKQINMMYSKQNIMEGKISKSTDSYAVSMKVVFPGITIDVKGENITADTYNLFVPYPKKVTP